MADYDYGNPEVEQIRAAIEALPQETGQKMLALFASPGLSLNDLDVKAVMELARLHLTLQQQVMRHLETEKVHVCNSRSKARFLVSACERAKQGALDVRGYGAIDPWKSHLTAIAVKLPKQLELMKEAEYIDRVGENASVNLDIDVTICQSLSLGAEKRNENGDASVELTLPVISTVQDLKDTLFKMGSSIPTSQMKLKVVEPEKPLTYPGDPMLTATDTFADVGYLRNELTLGFYNFPTSNGAHPDAPNSKAQRRDENLGEMNDQSELNPLNVKLVLSKKFRGGLKRKRDWSMMNEQPVSRKPLLAAPTIGPGSGGSMGGAIPPAAPGAALVQAPLQRRM